MISGFWTAPIWFAWKWNYFLARHLEMRCLAETIGPGKLLSQVLWSQITHLKRQETRQWAWRDCECLRYVTNMHTHTNTLTHISEALFAVTQECPYTFSDSPAYLRQKKAGSLTEVNWHLNMFSKPNKFSFVPRPKMRPNEPSNWRARRQTDIL